MKNFVVGVRIEVEPENDRGKTKFVKEDYLINAETVTDAETKMHEYFRDSSFKFEVSKVVETRIVEYIN